MPNLPLYSNSITRICHSMIFGRKPNDLDEQWKGEKCLSMHQSLHKALTTCRAPLPPGKKYVAVQFLNKELIFYVVDTKGKGQEIFDEASKHLGLSDTELFGLAFNQDGDFIFIDLNLKVSKYAVRSWKTHMNGINGDGQPLLILHLRIKYYVDCHLLINEKIVRHHYYLQLRENVKRYAQPISQEKSFLLAALALQADLGNYNAEKHKNRYFEIANYFPAWIIRKIGEDFITRSIPSLHKDNAGLSRGEAQVGYIQCASECTAPHNLHLYRMRRKRGKVWGDVWLGVADSGIHIYEEVDNIKSLLSTFSWCDIAKLHFEKKKFEILSEGSPHCRRFTYFVQSEDLAKNLLWICRTTHHFHMANQGRVADLKKLEIDGGKPYRESYIYTDKLDQAREKQNTLQRNQLKSKVENSKVNFNGASDPNMVKKIAKMSGMTWENVGCLQNMPCSHHSMEALPLTNGSRFSSELKYKSQSIPCLPDCSLTPYCPPTEPTEPSHWCPTSNSTTSTLSSCTSNNTDSTCSCLSLAHGSTHGKLGSPRSNDGSHWVKCDSFEELPIRETTPEKVLQKVCISTFSDKHVRTASVYDAVNTQTDLVFTKAANKKEPHKPLKTLSQTSLEPAVSIPDYATSSLEPPASNKIIDVKRSPSFNIDRPQNGNKPCYMAQKQRQYTPHNRTAIRIGVSSLSRDQRLPLTLFNDRGITACGSEPNLYDNNNTTSMSTWLQRKLNSQSEMSLNILEQTKGSFVDALPSNNGKQTSMPDICNDEVDFCIPPPPAYRNEVENSSEDSVNSANDESCDSKSEDKNPLQPPPTPPNPPKDTPDILDIHQLRQRSQDLDLPLLSALCNDRSLLMLPKTVPTCSRQRHQRKDPLRFSRTTSLPSGDGMEAFLVNSGRPISWHVDSSQVPHWPEVSKPCSASWDYSIQKDLASEAIPRTASLDNSIVPPPLRPVSMKYAVEGLKNGIPSQTTTNYHNHMHSDALRLRTVSLENGIHQNLEVRQQPRPVSIDYTSHAHYSIVNNDLSRLRTIENGLHPPRSFLLSNDSLRPRTMSLENSLHRPVDYNHHPHYPNKPQNVVLGNCMSLPVTSLPSTILTSFIKTPVKHVRDHSSSSDSYRYDKNQMIPTKLLAGSLSNIPNGRLYQKGLSS